MKIPAKRYQLLGHWCAAAARLTADVFYSNAPMPPWWPYRWVRASINPDGTRALEVSAEQVCPW